jgi:flagellar hook assembly protein FlgD
MSEFTVDRAKKVIPIKNNQPKDKLAELKKHQQLSFKLITAQLKNQTIDNPADTNQMTQNILQMNAVQNLIGIDSKLDDITTMMQQSASLNSASNIIGKYAVSKGNDFAVENTSDVIPINYIINSNSGSVENVMVRVFDNAGKIVHESHLKDIPANSMQTFNWQTSENNFSTINPGTYRINIQTLNGNEHILADIYTSAKVQQVFADGAFITNSGRKLEAADIVALQDTLRPMGVATDSMLANAYRNGTLKQSISDLFKGV